MLQSARFLAARSFAARSLAFLTCARNAIGSGAGAESCALTGATTEAMANVAIPIKIGPILNIYLHSFRNSSAELYHGSAHRGFQIQLKLVRVRSETPWRISIAAKVPLLTTLPTKVQNISFRPRV